MKNRGVIYGLVGGLTILLLIFFFSNRRGGPKFQWYTNFDSDNDQPYGTLFIHRMLKTLYDGDFIDSQKKPVHEVLDDQKYNDGTYDYVLIGESVYFDKQDIAALKIFLNNGGNVFIATMEPPKELLDTLYTNDCESKFSYDYSLDTVVYANFYNSALNKTADYEYRFRIGAADVPFDWRSLSDDGLCDTTANLTPLGYQQGEDTNFMVASYGPGRLFLHTSPLMFTNYYMTKPDKMEYASSVFSYLDGENVIWDEVSKVPFLGGQSPYQSPLYYIMQQPALKYAWWMFVAGVLLYVIFASKRTQRVIPVLEAKTNTSLEFLTVISSLHYQNPNHLDMARKKMRYFLYFIRAKYGINTQALTEEQSKRLAERSKVDIADIQAIIDHYKLIENYSISDDEPERLIGLYQTIEKFYKTCK